MRDLTCPLNGQQCGSHCAWYDHASSGCKALASLAWIQVDTHRIADATAKLNSEDGKLKDIAHAVLRARRS